MKIKAVLLMCLMLGANNISAVSNEIIKAILTSMVGGGTNGAFNAASRFFTEEAMKWFMSSKNDDIKTYENKQSEYKNYLPHEHMKGEPSFLHWEKGNDICIKMDENKLIFLKSDELTILNPKNYAVLKSYTFVRKNSNNTCKSTPKIIPISTGYISEDTTMLNSNGIDGELGFPLGAISKVIPIPTNNCLCIIFEYGKCIFLNWMNGKILDNFWVDGGQNKELLEKYYGEMSYACLANSPGIEDYWHIAFDPIVNAWFWYDDECLYLSVKCKSKKIATVIISSKFKQQDGILNVKE